MTEIPLGLVGARPRQPVGVHVSMALTGENGAPTMGGRFWFTTQATQSRKFGGNGRKEWSRLTRDLEPRFRAWNAECHKLGEELALKRGAGRVGFLKGNIVHARWSDAASWNRAASKLPAPNPNPPSRRPACEGNGLWALRFRGAGKDGVERFDRIACPNRLCEFAESGACKPDTHFFFKLRWDRSDAFEAQFPELIAHWHTGGWESTEALMGLFEYVLGTEALLGSEDLAQATEEERAAWRPGFAAALGLKPSQVNLVGMPFAMSVHYRTKAGDEKNPGGKRFPVVSFSTDGDLEAWLVSQAQTRRTLIAAAPEPLTLPAVSDPDFIDVTRHEARIETSGLPLSVDPLPPVDGPVAERVAVRDPLPPADKTPLRSGPALLTPAKIESLLRHAVALSGNDPEVGEKLLARAAEAFHSKGDLTQVLASLETDVLRELQRLAQSDRRKP